MILSKEINGADEQIFSEARKIVKESQRKV